MKMPWPFRRVPSTSATGQPLPSVRALLDALFATAPSDPLDLEPLQTRLRTTPVPPAEVTEGLVRVLARALEPRFRRPDLAALFLVAGADPNALLPRPTPALRTALQSAVYLGLVTEDTAGVWARAGAAWNEPGRLLPLAFAFRPLTPSDQARTLVALAPYVPPEEWSRPMPSGRTPRREWESLKNTRFLAGAVHARMEALDGEPGRAQRLQVDLEKTLPRPPASPPPHARSRL